MDEQEFRKQLTLKPVEEEHIDQFNELLSYVFQVTDYPRPLNMII